jgi:hypothetical protein
MALRSSLQCRSSIAGQMDGNTVNRLKPPGNAKIFETPLLMCWFEGDGILYSVSKAADRTIENYDILFGLYQKLSKNGKEKLCTLGDITNTEHLSTEVREYITKELPKYIKAMALISATQLGTAIGNFFVKANPQSYPTQIFNNRQDAVIWLKKIQSRVLMNELEI